MSRSRVFPRNTPMIPTRALSGQQDPAVFRDVVELQSAGNPGHDSEPTGKSDGVERPIRPRLGRAEPDLFAGGSPGEAVLARPLTRQGLLLAGEVDHGDRSGIVERKRMIEKGDQIAFR